MVAVPCTGCGLVVDGGTAGCQRLFEAIGLRELEDARFARWHRLVVDVYALQHPDRYGRSAKSFAAHLTGVCAYLEHPDALPVNAAVQRWLNGPSPIERPQMPASFGATTIADVKDALLPADFGRALDRWARTTWDAYADLQPLARTWIETAMSARP